MIRKMKRRYFITNMALLSATLLISLAVLFGVLYHAEITSSYSLMQEMMKEEPPEGFHPPRDMAPAMEPVRNTVSERNQEDWEFMKPPSGDWDTWDKKEHWWAPPSDPPVTGSRPWWDPPQDDGNGDDMPDWTMPPQHTMFPPRDEDFHGGETRPTRPMDSEPVTEPAEGTSLPQTGMQTETVNTTAPSAHTQYTETVMQVVTDATTCSALETTSTLPLVPVEEGHYIPDAVIAKIDPDGNVAGYVGNDAAISDDDHLNIVHHAMKDARKRGNKAGTIQVGEDSYRYLFQPAFDGSSRLVLLDRSLERATLHRLLYVFLLISVVGLGCMFVVSHLLANWTVTPVAAAWEKQKQFVADASHELKTPLAVIAANTEVIQANPTGTVAEQQKWLGYIQSETLRMSKLITVLLSVARMDSNDTKSEPAAPLHLSSLVSNTCLSFEPIVYEKGKTLNTVIQHNVQLRADEDDIRQLLSILLDNAILHSTPHAQITVTLSKDTQGKIRLAVSNTAKDIPQAQLVHLFDRFYRLDKEGSPNGSGLGLSIARSIVRQLGGQLTVTSENSLVTFVALFS